MEKKDTFKTFDEFISEKKWAADVKPKQGSMRNALDIPDGKKIEDIYKSGKKLAEDLVKKVGKKKAASMINFVANVDSEHNIYDEAQKHLHTIKESSDFNFYEHELEKVEKYYNSEDEYAIYKILLTCGDFNNTVRTKFMSITPEQFQEIKAILLK